MQIITREVDTIKERAFLVVYSGCLVHILIHIEDIKNIIRTVQMKDTIMMKEGIHLENIVGKDIKARGLNSYF